jgi:dTDP-4-amino-4,6-dideoxygalactose transaminase
MIPVARPKLPNAEAILPFLRRIDETRIYSNFGPLVRELEAGLASHFSIDPTEIVSCTNATLGLAAVLRVVARPGGRCLMPSWTFCASAHAVQLAGLKPVFLDVDPQTWCLTTAVVDAALAEGPAAVVMPVGAFGIPVDPHTWDCFSDRTGTPVVIDAAAAFAGQEIGRSACVVSLHATKSFGVGEGGLVAARDRQLIAEVLRATNFGFLGERRAQRPAFNGKMSEYSAAVGLAALADWPRTREQWLRVAARYWVALDCLGQFRSPMKDIVTANLIVGFDAPHGEVAQRLLSRGVATRSWYGAGCHREPAFADCPALALPVTDRLANRTLGVPFFLDMKDAEIERVVEELGAAVGDSVSPGKS